MLIVRTICITLLSAFALQANAWVGHNDVYLWSYGDGENVLGVAQPPIIENRKGELR